MTSIRLRVSRVRAGGDAGISLLEVVVAMSIMAMLMAMFTTGFIAMYRSAHQVEVISTAQSQVDIAFQRLDKEIRYATQISAPEKNEDNGDWYVEYLGYPNDGKSMCTQLRLHDGQLQRSIWTLGSRPSTVTWTQLASKVSSDTPFETMEDLGSGFQHLRVRLQAKVTASGTTNTARLDTTFYALNSSAADDETKRNVCAIDAGRLTS